MPCGAGSTWSWARPGRVIDHMNRGTLKLSGLTLLVLDEADEMLRMGFIDAVESILEQTPPQRQVALFSATIPAPIRRIAAKHLRSPVEITIKSKTSTATNIRQRYWMVSGMHKLDALTRILEAETFDGMLVFTRTKQSTVELAEKLEARGFAAAPLNGDIAQPLRERTVARLKAGQIDIVVATDVAARGLDVERIGHVVNYDVPYDTESYVHRIGRTGRAGRKGEAILFIAPRERNMLRAIERATRQVIEPMNLPTRRCGQYAANRQVQATDHRDPRPRATPSFRPVLEQLETETGLTADRHRRRARELVAGFDAAAAGGQGGAAAAGTMHRDAGRLADRARAADRAPPREVGSSTAERPPRPPKASASPAASLSSRSMETFRIEVGSVHGIKPGNIVGAIANEAGHRGRAYRPRGYSRGSQLRRLAGRHAEADIQAIAKGARGGPRASHQPGQRKAAEAAARDSTGRHVERKMLSRRKTKNSMHPSWWNQQRSESWARAWIERKRTRRSRPRRWKRSAPRNGKRRQPEADCARRSLRAAVNRPGNGVCRLRNR